MIADRKVEVSHPMIFYYGFTIAVLVIGTPPQYFAKEMAKADELKMLRIMVSRSEVNSSNRSTN